MIMKLNNSRTLPYAVLLCILFVTGCGIGPVGGNSSETTNGLTAAVTTDAVEGTAPPFSTLYLIGDAYDPFSGKPFDSVATDSTGFYRFTVAQGGYNLFCRNTDTLQVRLHVLIGGTAIGVNDTLRDTLTLPGSMEGYAPLFEDTSVTSYLYLEGTPFFTIADDRSGYFRIDHIPQGRYTVKTYSVKSSQMSMTESVDTLSSESSTVIGIAADSVVTFPWRP